jgi:hypothetical protein
MTVRHRTRTDESKRTNPVASARLSCQSAKRRFGSLPRTATVPPKSIGRSPWRQGHFCTAAYGARWTASIASGAWLRGMEMHRYRVVERWTDRSLFALRCNTLHYHVARVLNVMPPIDAALNGDRPHFGFGILVGAGSGARQGWPGSGRRGHLERNRHEHDL